MDRKAKSWMSTDKRNFDCIRTVKSPLCAKTYPTYVCKCELLGMIMHVGNDKEINKNLKYLKER